MTKLSKLKGKIKGKLKITYSICCHFTDIHKSPPVVSWDIKGPSYAYFRISAEVAVFAYTVYSHMYSI